MQLRDLNPDARIVLVAIGQPDVVSKFLSHYRLPYVTICDPNRELFRAAGLKTMSPFRIWTFPAILETLKLVLKGRQPQIRGGVPAQLGGVMILDRDGAVRWSYQSKNVADNPQPAEILAQLGAVSEPA